MQCCQLSRQAEEDYVVQNLQKRTSNLNSCMKHSKLSKPYQIKLTAISRFLIILQIKLKATLTITLLKRSNLCANIIKNKCVNAA